MATVAEQVQQLYIGLLGYAADESGATYWEDQINTNALDIAGVSANLVATADYSQGLGALTREEAITELYDRMFGRAPEDAGLEYWSTGGGSTVSVDQLALTFMDAALSTDVTALENKTAAAAAYTAAAGDDYSTTEAATILASVDDSAASLTTVLASIEALYPAVIVVDNTVYLTSGTDRNGEFNGTTGNDEFVAYLEQNSFAGGVSNSLSSADVLDGSTGTDTLYAEIVPEFFGATGDNQIDIQPRTTSIEEVQFEARDSGSNDVNDNTTVTVDAKNMLDIDKIGSYMSDGDLVIENLTTAQSDGEDRNTEDLTITMDHTDNFNSDIT